MPWVSALSAVGRFMVMRPARPSRRIKTSSLAGGLHDVPLTFLSDLGISRLRAASRRQRFRLRRKCANLAAMTVWQKISGLATAVGDAGGSLLDELGRTFRLGRSRRGAREERRLHHRRHRAVAPRWPRPTASSRRWRSRPSSRCSSSRPSEAQQRRARLRPRQAGRGRLRDLRRPDRRTAQGRQEAAAGRAGGPDARGDGRRRPAPQGGRVPARGRRSASASPRASTASSAPASSSDNDNPYDVLRSSPAASNDEIKAQYRKLVLDNHPDKLMGRGVPAEFVEIATRKLAAINAAYDTIAKERGL